MELLEAGRWPLLELHLREDLDAACSDRASDLARKMGAKVLMESSDRLFELCHTRDNQGLLARMGDFPYAKPTDALPEGIDPFRLSPPPLLVLLDSLRDPHNFGAILRSAEVLGANAVCVGTDNQCEVNNQVARSSSGAINRVPLVRVESLPDLAADLRRRGFVVVAASEKAESNLDSFDFNRPVALVLGNEGEGVGPELLAACDVRLSIPQSGTVGSLNVAAAAAIFFYEAQKQRHGRNHA
jgi:23S rRNA (guanosine2251-2'-O)-methyltransferase